MEIALPNVVAAVQQFVKPGTIVYRGMRIGPQSQQMSIRQILSHDYLGRGRAYDHWSLSQKVAQDFAKGIHMNQDGTMGNKAETIRFIVAARINPQDVDLQEFGRILSGANYNHLNGASYFDMSGQKQVGGSQAEQEIPVLKARYPSIKLLSYSVMDQMGQWRPGKNPNKLA